jgi:hypothetical protein
VPPRSGTHGSGLAVRWDNTLTLSAGQRLYGGKDDGAGYFFGFGAGAASIYDRGAYTPFRTDLLSELEIDYADFGLRTSAASRYEKIETPGGYRADLACNRNAATE